jgi:RNA polymerase sigma-70 factor (ECF subfamily)
MDLASPLPDDRALLAAFAHEPSRDRAFTEIVRAYGERLYWHIRRMVTEHEDANDVLQNVFIKAWKGLQDFRGESGLYTWLYRIATNETISWLDARKRRAVVPLDVGNNGTSNGPADRIASQEGFNGRRVEWQLQHAVNQLPEKQRLVFNLRYFDEMPYEQMSGVLGTSVGALKASYHHAVKKIEAFFKAL